MKKNTTEEIEELRKKLALIEGERKAYYETAEYKQALNHKYINKLRIECQNLRKKKAGNLAADENVVNKGLGGHQRERIALRDKTGDIAVDLMDKKILDHNKRLNALRHKTNTKIEKVEAAKTRFNEMVKDSSKIVETDAGQSAEAQTLRILENRLVKLNLKCKEAEHIKTTYNSIKAGLESEHQTYGKTLTYMESEIVRVDDELEELKIMSNDAEIARENAKLELDKLEKKVYFERKEREQELAKVKKEADEKKTLHDKIERRIARNSISNDDSTPSDKLLIPGEEDQQKFMDYEQAFKFIKEATGVSDTQEVVTRFVNQGETKSHLEMLQKTNEKNIMRLKEESEKLKNEFEDMKYSGEAKLSSGQRILEEMQNELETAITEKDDLSEQYDKAARILVAAKAGVEHIGEKLKLVKAPSSQVQIAKIPETSDEYVLDKLSLCDSKLLALLDELDGKELSEVINEIEDEDFENSNEIKPTTANTRVKLPASPKKDVYDIDVTSDEDDSGDNEISVNRSNLKKLSESIVNAKKSKRKMPRKKKPKK